jgi:hypothetical protein
MAKFLVLSLLRTRFSGDIVVFKNTPEPLFMVPRAGVREIFIKAKPPKKQKFWDYAQSWKFRVRHHIDVAGYDKVLFLDADCLALQNIDSLLAGRWDIGIYPEPGTRAGMHWYNTFIPDEEASELTCEGINGGTLAVRAAIYHDVMAEWERIHSGRAVRPRFLADQGALTRLVLDTSLRQRRYLGDDIATPFAFDQHPGQYFGSRMVHLAGTVAFELKLRFMFGLYLNTFFFDQQATLLHILDL